MSRYGHAVTNQAPPLAGYNAWSANRLLIDAVAREGGAWIADEARQLGALVGSGEMQTLVVQANRYPPELRTHDPAGNRIDTVEYHPAYHELMRRAFCAGLHSLAWTAHRPGAFVARAALIYLWNQVENGVACPVTMSFAARQVLRHDATLAAEWEPKLFARDYDPRPLPLAAKRAVTLGMAMTEKQGGSDLRTNETCAIRTGGVDYELTGHKWFCSAPMSDGFFTLARAARMRGRKPEGEVTCFFVARTLSDGSRNPFRIQRLKDKCGNRSNASAEIEYEGTLARRIGEEGRGIATLIEMAHFTRFDIVVAAAGMIRAAFEQAAHHCAHRRAFGRLLTEQPLMQNVLADLALEAEAAMLLAFRLARAFDDRSDPSNQSNDDARLLARAMTPVAKYWLCKRLPAVVVEAMECIGGNGYVEEHALARLYREAPLNGIWEGSGNVVCLDWLRSLEKSSRSAELLLEEIRTGGPRLVPMADAIAHTLKKRADLETGARRIVERIAVALQASLMARYADAATAETFCVSRLDGDCGRTFGTLPVAADFKSLLSRSALV